MSSNPLSSVKIDFELPNIDDNDQQYCKLIITAQAKTNAGTGVEMEALHAVSTAALTIYDMCKAVDKAMMIGDITLDYKEGGKSGIYDAHKG